LDHESIVEARGLEASHPRQLIFTHKSRKLAGSIVSRAEDLKSTEPLDVKLAPAGTITGKLVDEDGRPWAGAKLQVVMMTLDGGQNLPFGPGSLWPSDEPVLADPHGYFRLEGLVPGVRARISVEASNRPGLYLDCGQAFANPVTKPGEVRDLGEVKATPMAR
ncbi:carboxypeptidase-like regulatory domain-containing protein, partial [Singulisphaera rosea]